MNTTNNKLQHISKGLDELMIDLTVTNMLNPQNKDFYIGELTLDKLAEIFIETDDLNASISTIFWKAFNIAQAKYLNNLDTLDKPDLSNEIDGFDTCPLCDCPHYIAGVACPNCDYIEGGNN